MPATTESVIPYSNVPLISNTSLPSSVLNPQSTQQTWIGLYKLEESSFQFCLTLFTSQPTPLLEEYVALVRSTLPIEQKGHSMNYLKIIQFNNLILKANMTVDQVLEWMQCKDKEKWMERQVLQFIMKLYVQHMKPNEFNENENMNLNLLTRRQSISSSRSTLLRSKSTKSQKSTVSDTNSLSLESSPFESLKKIDLPVEFSKTIHVHVFFEETLDQSVIEAFENRYLGPLQADHEPNLNSTPPLSYPLQDSPKYLQKRFHILQEWLETEKSHVLHLTHLRDHYMLPLSKYLTLTQYKNSFMGVEAILQLNSRYYQELERVMQGEDSDTDRLKGLVSVTSGLLDSFLRTYRPYVNGYWSAREMLKTSCRSNQSLGHFLAQQEQSHTIRLSVFDLLILPVQRPPRYMLLLQDLLVNCPSTNEAFTDLLQLYEKMMVFVRQLDVSKKRADETFQMFRLFHERVEQCPVTLMHPDRWFIAEYSVLIQTKEFLLVLFNDALLLAKKISNSGKSKKQYKFKHFLPLEKCHLKQEKSTLHCQCQIDPIQYEMEWTNENEMKMFLEKYEFWQMAGKRVQCYHDKKCIFHTHSLSQLDDESFQFGFIVSNEKPIFPIPIKIWGHIVPSCSLIHWNTHEYDLPESISNLSLLFSWNEMDWYELVRNELIPSTIQRLKRRLTRKKKDDLTLEESLDNLDLE